MQRMNYRYKKSLRTIVIAGLVNVGLSLGLNVGLSLGDRVIAQSCYMVTASGQKVSLGPLCGEIPPEPASNNPAATGKKAGGKNGVYRVPIKRRLASTPVIDVTFNGKTFEMILDTGASSTLITKRMSDALGLRPTGGRPMIIADGSRVTFPMAVVNQVGVGGLVVPKLQVTVAPNSDIGLLGHDFFGRYDIKIKRNVVEFYLPTD